MNTGYTAQDVVDVSSDNAVRVGQNATRNYAIHQFKDFVGSVSSCTLTCDYQSTLAPSLSSVHLQIFNRITTTWTDVAVDSTSAANVDFTLTGNIPDLTNYKDAANMISCRVYQQAIL